MLYFLLAFAVLFILAQAWLLYKFVNRITELSEQRDKALKDYEALDKGMVELSDAYETDCLQYEDSLEKLTEEKTDLARRNDEQAQTIDGLRRANDEYFQENRGIRRQLDISQVIISEHDANCLPHIIFDKFKTPDGQISLFQDFDIENNQVKFTGIIDRNQLI